jgi:hypothetical protein
MCSLLGGNAQQLRQMPASFQYTWLATEWCGVDSLCQVLAATSCCCVLLWLVCRYIVATAATHGITPNACHLLSTAAAELEITCCV